MAETSMRVATRADVPAILTLYAQPDIDDGDVLPLARAEEIFQRMTRDSRCTIFVAERGERIVGTFIFLVLEKISHQAAPSAIVEDVVVAPDMQSQGVGGDMMRFAMERAAALGCYKLALSSNLKRERAHAFYEKLGFERHGYSFKIDLVRKPESH